MTLFFDVETTGLIKDYKHITDGSENFPHIVQLGYALFAEDGKLILKTSNIIKPTGWKIEPSAEKIHGISLETCEEKGISIHDALIAFMSMNQNAGIKVAHNYNFDSRIIRSELIRLGSQEAANYFKSGDSYCTMLKNIKFCNIRNPKTKFRTMKYPKLIELYKKLFNEELKQTHDALDDVMATAKCYFELKKRNLLN